MEGRFQKVVAVLVLTTLIESETANAESVAFFKMMFWIFPCGDEPVRNKPDEVMVVEIDWP